MTVPPASGTAATGPSMSATGHSAPAPRRLAPPGHTGHRMGSHDLPAVVDTARLEGPVQHPAVERLERRRIADFVGDIRKLPWASTVELGPGLVGGRLIDREGPAQRVCRAEHGAEAELCALVQLA